MVDTRSGEWVRHSSEGRIQERRKADGTVVYRARKDGKVSNSYPTLEGAIRWRDDLPAQTQTATPARAPVGVVDPEALGLPT